MEEVEKRGRVRLTWSLPPPLIHWRPLILFFDPWLLEWTESHKYRRRKQQVWMHNLWPEPHLNHLYLRHSFTPPASTRCLLLLLLLPSTLSLCLPAISLWRNLVAMSLSFSVAKLAPVLRCMHVAGVPMCAFMWLHPSVALSLPLWIRDL